MTLPTWRGAEEKTVGVGRYYAGLLFPWLGWPYLPHQCSSVERGVFLCFGSNLLCLSGFSVTAFVWRRRFILRAQSTIEPSLNSNSHQNEASWMGKYAVIAGRAGWPRSQKTVLGLPISLCWPRPTPLNHV